MFFTVFLATKNFYNALIEFVQTLRGTNFFVRFPEKASLCREIRKKVKTVLTSIRYYGNFDVNITKFYL